VTLMRMVTACDRCFGTKLRAELGQATSIARRSRYTWNENAARVLTVARSLIAARAVRPALAPPVESSPDMQSIAEGAPGISVSNESVPSRTR
jgi:hypothetical protein